LNFLIVCKGVYHLLLKISAIVGVKCFHLPLFSVRSPAYSEILVKS